MEFWFLYILPMVSLLTCLAYMIWRDGRSVKLAPAILLLLIAPIPVFNLVLYIMLLGKGFLNAWSKGLTASEAAQFIKSLWKKK